MSKKIKVVNNIKGALGFYRGASEETFIALPKQGTFFSVTQDELNYIHVNQTIIQKGMLWIDEKEARVKLGLEQEDGTKENENVIQHDEIAKLIKGNYKRLESVLGKITEPSIIKQFVEVARELKIDSKAKIDMIEKKSNMTIFSDED